MVDGGFAVLAAGAGELGTCSAGSETSGKREADAEGADVVAPASSREKPGSTLSRTEVLMRRMVGSLLVGAKGIAFTSQEPANRTTRAFTSSNRELIFCSFHICPTDNSV